MKKTIITQTNKLKTKFFGTKSRIIVSTLIFLIVGAGVFLIHDYIVKGATYGWVQSTWSGGADTNAVATHTDNQTNWTKYYSKDSNVDTSNDQLTLSSGSTSVEDTTTADFDAGSDSGTALVFDTSGDQLTASVGYDATGICGNFEVWPMDRSTTAKWATAVSYCNNLCPTCTLPTSTELACICNNKASFGNNFVAHEYWSATLYNSTDAYDVYFSGSCNTYTFNKSGVIYVRCIRR